MSDPSTNDDPNILLNLDGTLYDERDRADNDEARKRWNNDGRGVIVVKRADFAIVRRVDFEQLAAALNHHDHSSDFDIFNAVLDAARRLVDGATQRDDTGSDDGTGQR